MAPSVEVPVLTQADSVARVILKNDSSNDNKFHYKPGRTAVERHDNYAYDDLLPSFPDLHWEPLDETSYVDRGISGDPQFRDLLQDATNIFDYNPKIGTEVQGINLAKLTEAQKDDLARLVAVRGVVFFRDQGDFDIEAQRELGKHMGKLHKVCRTRTKHY